MKERIKLKTFNKQNGGTTFLLSYQNRNILVGQYLLYMYPEKTEKTSELSKYEEEGLFNLSFVDAPSDKVSRLVNLVLFNLGKDKFQKAESPGYKDLEDLLMWNDDKVGYDKVLYGPYFTDFSKLKSEDYTIWVKSKYLQTVKKSSDEPIKVEINRYLAKYTFADGAILVVPRNLSPEEIFL